MQSSNKHTSDVQLGTKSDVQIPSRETMKTLDMRTDTIH